MDEHTQVQQEPHQRDVFLFLLLLIIIMCNYFTNTPQRTVVVVPIFFPSAFSRLVLFFWSKLLGKSPTITFFLLLRLLLLV